MFNLSETVKISCHMNHSQQLELSLGKRTELICINVNVIFIVSYLYCDLYNEFVNITLLYM